MEAIGNNLLDGRLIVVVSEQVRRIISVLKFDNFNSKARLSSLNGFMVQ